MTPDAAVEHLCPVPHIPEAVAAVRRRARTVLAGWSLPPDTADDALLVISELVTNAVTHARPPAVLRLARTQVDGHRALRIEVTDAGPASHGQRPSDLQPEEHGRGIPIVAALSARHGVRSHCGGVTRWADIETS
ncbi:ATP-binding protein [Streptomyces himalayensis]|uniref:ATP-binding protein n=1 Tax=Streptomyces himalayensis subsp. himalayensis TaxID=2756131 RepID=A0A7W0DSS5_9ACTN|nr:ATP-binding protein [Streptomyces himalayensis]MBA2950572.1 ATP-binding protein [Streptomyces himalayensis subsp. himalayensis]